MIEGLAPLIGYVNFYIHHYSLQIKILVDYVLFFYFNERVLFLHK